VILALLILFVGGSVVSASAQTVDVDEALGRPGGVTGVLWDLASDDEFAEEWLAGVERS